MWERKLLNSSTVQQITWSGPCHYESISIQTQTRTYGSFFDQCWVFIFLFWCNKIIKKGTGGSSQIFVRTSRTNSLFTCTRTCHEHVQKDFAFFFKTIVHEQEHVQVPTSKTHHSRSFITGHPLAADMLYNATLRYRSPSNMSYVDHQRVLTSLGGSLNEMSFTEHDCLSLVLNFQVQYDCQCHTENKVAHNKHTAHTHTHIRKLHVKEKMFWKHLLDVLKYLDDFLTTLLGALFLKTSFAKDVFIFGRRWQNTCHLWQKMTKHLSYNVLQRKVFIFGRSTATFIT